jgi:hypothetical protein
MKPCLKKEGGGNGTVMEGVNLFKVHCTHGWNYHNEPPLVILMYANSKVK